MKHWLRKTGLLAAVVAGLGSAASAADKVVIQNGSPVPAAAYLDWYVADVAGFCEEEGLVCETRYSQGAPQALQITASGGADFGMVAMEPYLFGYENGMRGKYYFNSYPYNAFFIAVPEDSEIQTAQDLEGKKIGVIGMGSNSLIVARSILRNAGIEPDPSMFLPVGLGDSATQALMNGTVDALSLWDGGYAGMEAAGIKLRYIHHNDIGFIGNAGVFIADDALEARRDMARRLFRALVKARIFITESPDAALDIYWRVNPAAKVGDTEEAARERGLIEIGFMSPFVIKGPISEVGRFDISQYETFLQVMDNEGVLPDGLTVDGFVSNEIMDTIGEIDPEPVRKRAQEWK